LALKYRQIPKREQGTTLADVNVTNESTKLKIDEFLKRNQLNIPTTLGRIFKITEEEGIAYRLFIKNELMLSFNEKGEWIHAEIEKENDNDNKDNISIELIQDGIWSEISASHIAENLKVTPLSLPSKIIR